MHVRDALDQLDAIHDHLTRAEVYPGFRAPGVALTGTAGLAAAAAQPAVVTPSDPTGFVVFWVSVAAGCAAVSFGLVAYSFAFREGEFERRRTLRVLGQFLPCLGVGAAVTLVFARGGPEMVAYLPGVWAMLFGLGVVSARPHLARGVGWVGVFYLAAGAAVLARPPADLSGWAVGGVFGPGHLLTAVVLARQPRGESDA